MHLPWNPATSIAAMLIVMSAANGLAQTGVHPQRLGTIAVSFAPDAIVPYSYGVPAFVPFDVYIVADIDFADIGLAAQNYSNGIIAWDGQVTFSTPNVMVVGQVYHPSNAINIGSGMTNFIIGTGTTILANTLPAPLVTMSLMVANQLPLTTIDLRGPDPANDLGEPSWVDKLTINGCTSELTGLPSNCRYRWAQVIDGTMTNEVPTESHSWGQMKRAFHE